MKKDTPISKAKFLENIQSSIDEYGNIMNRLEEAKNKYGERFPPALEKTYIKMHSKLDHIKEKKREAAAAGEDAWQQPAEGAEKLKESFEEMVSEISMQIKF